MAADQPGLFQPLAVTVVALAAPSVDPVSGDCAVTVGTASTLVEHEFRLFVEGTTVDLGSGQELCRVLRTVDKDPGDQGAVARVLNKAPRPELAHQGRVGWPPWGQRWWVRR